MRLLGSWPLLAMFSDMAALEIRFGKEVPLGKMSEEKRWLAMIMFSE